jgi:P4 family phage/plasmid primase-like protien
MLEFEAETPYLAFKDGASKLGLGALVERIESGYMEKTPGGGCHWLYRCEEIAANTKLAKDSDDRILIETRGEGGYVVTAPSHGKVHPTGKPYVLISGGFASIATISPEERRELFNLARSFGKMPIKDEHKAPDVDADGTRPGDDFNHRATWEDILRPAGWTPVYGGGETQYWRRPGKDRGVSASTDFNGSGFLFVFSTSTGFEAGRGYSKFSVYALLFHGGDFNAAARELSAKGYGEKARQSGQEARPDANPEGAGAGTVNLTDLGNARRLVARHGADLRYCWPWGRWIVWDGIAWRQDDTAEVLRRAKDTVRGIYQEAAACDDRDRRDALGDWARRSENETKINAMVSLARSEPVIPILPTELDADPMLLPVQNGVLDLRQNTFIPGHRKSELITKIVSITFDPVAECPVWMDFLYTIMAGNQDMIDFLQRCAGYSLTGDVTEHMLLILYGSGANGKSVFLNTLLALTGPYGKQAAPDLLLATRYDRHPTELADLLGIRALISSETDQGRRLAEARIKSLTGGDPIKARYMHGDFFTFPPTHKIWMATNHKPIVRGTDRGIWRRLKLIPFTVTIPDSEQDKHLQDKLLVELPGILNWAVKGCLLWQKNGLWAPKEVMAATEGYRTENDVLQMFIDDRCVVNPLAKTKSSDLYGGYIDWSKANGEREVPQRQFCNAMQDRGFETKRAKSGNWFHGIGLAHQADDRRYQAG